VEDTAAQATLIGGLETEEIFAGNDGTYTSNGASLSALEASLDRRGGVDGSIHVVVATVMNVDDSVLLYARSSLGTWFGLRHVREGTSADPYRCLGTAVADVDDMADCTGDDW